MSYTRLESYRVFNHHYRVSSSLEFMIEDQGASCRVYFSVSLATERSLPKNPEWVFGSIHGEGHKPELWCERRPSEELLNQ